MEMCRSSQHVERRSGVRVSRWLGGELCAFGLGGVVGRRVVVSGGETDLDRVLCGEADEPLVAAQGCRETEKGQVVAGMAFVAVVESAVAGQPGHGPLDHPPTSPKSLGGLDAFAGDADADAFAS